MQYFSYVISTIDSLCKQPAIFDLLSSLQQYDKTTFEHCIHVAYYSIQMGCHYQFDETILYELAQAAILHDIGKLRIPLQILQKPSKLTDTEYREIQKHPVFSSQILEEYHFPKSICNMVKMHHRNYNGSGYPEGQLPKEPYITCINVLHLCDSYDAIRSERPYKPALNHEIAMQLCTPYANIQYPKSLLQSMNTIF